MGKKRKNIVLGVLFILCININSQDKRFHHITSNDGLSQSEVYCFLKDSRGFMWFGTVDGLNFYDGYDIKTFTTKRNNKKSLSNNTIRSLAEDKFGRIWIGTDDGLNLYNPESELIHQIIPISVFSNKLTINSILVYDNHIFLGTRHGLLRIDLTENKEELGKGQIQQVVLDSLNHSNFNIIKLKHSKYGGFWVQTNNMVSRIIVESHSSKAITIETPVANPTFNFLDLIEDQSNNLWISCNRSGIIRYSITEKKIRIFKTSGNSDGPSSLKCSGLSIDNNGNVWIGTLDNGINLIKYDQVNSDDILFEYIQHQPLNPSSVISNLVYSLYATEDNIMWIGTIGSGISFFDSDQKKFNHLRINTSSNKGSNFIRAVYEISDHKLWVGTHSNGLHEINRSSNKTKKLGLKNMSVFYIAPYLDNKNFICSDEGLFLVEEYKGEIKILSHATQHAAFYLSKGDLDYYWLASFNGLYQIKIINDRISIHKHYPLTTSDSPTPKNCRVLHFDHRKRTLLIGTEGDGLHSLLLNEKQEVIKNKVFKSCEQPGSISNNYIRSIIQDSDENYWIGTYEGLNKMVQKPESEEYLFQIFTKDDGLPNNMIHSIINDEKKNLWIGTNNGLSKYITSSNQFINYSKSDGIQSNEFSEHTAYRSKKGEILIGGINGVTTFYPKEITHCNRNPQTTITDFYIDGKRVSPNEQIGNNTPLKKGVSVLDTIILLPNQNNIGFDFSSLLFPDAEKTKYEYKLNGFNKNWQITDESIRHANYTNLRHGRYTFEVRSINTDGIWEDEGKKLFIHIKTPFIYTWYAYILYLLIIVLIIIYFSYFSIIRYTTKNKLLLEQEHNKKVHALNKIRTEFFINISHDLRTPLTLIKGPLESILRNNNLSEDIKDHLLLIRRNVKRLNYLIEQLLDVRKAEREKLIVHLEPHDIVSFSKKEIAHFTYAIKNKGLKYKVSSSNTEIALSFDSAMLSKVYFNLISNAIKYTETGEIEIKINKVQQLDYPILRNSLNKSFVKIEVIDTGKGIAANKINKVFQRFYQENTLRGKGYGIGLSHTSELIGAHQGFIEAESKENHGTTIRFFLPEITHPGAKVAEISSSEDDIYRDDNDEAIKKDITSSNKSDKTILVVEDNADMRAYIKSELIAEYNVLEAEDGLKGIEMATNNDIDLIISDIMMPNMDGMDYCKHIKTDLNTCHIPIILLTAKTDNQSKYQGIETGADDYISKPFEMEYLIIRIKNLLQTREQLQKSFLSKDSLLNPSTVTVNSLDERFLEDLLAALEYGIPDSEFKVSSLEEKLGMSHSNFYRKVKSLTGQSGKELLHDMRMKRARQVLLDNKNIRIDEVAYMVGFTNPKYFGKSFKESFGISPTEMKNTEM